METTTISYEVDGREMIGTLVVPDGSGPRPAVLVAHEGGGLDDHARTMARRLAELGYAAFALDYHGGGERLADRNAINERLIGLIGDVDRVRALGRAGLDWRMNLYGGAAHSFTNPDAHLAGFAGIEYHEPTAKRSWRAMLDLFDEVFPA